MRREEGLENESLENIDISNEQGKRKPVKNSEIGRSQDRVLF